jgi:flotillin
LARAVAEPLAKTEKIVVIDQGGNTNGTGGAAKISGYVADIISALPETVEAITGVNFLDGIKNKLKAGGGKDPQN